MKLQYTPLLMFAGFFVFPTKVNAQLAVIQSVTPKSGIVEKNGKFEALIDLSAVFANPYDYDEIRVEAVFTDPDGKQTTVEGFYMEDFEIANTSTGSLNTLPVKGFRIRFSPRKTGVWSYKVSCTNAAGTAVFPAQTFGCTAELSPANKGFVQAGMRNFLSFENGEQYVPIGENMAWHNSNPYVDYKRWVGKMADNGGNFLRLWLCHWGMGLEWKLNADGFSGLKKYKQSSAFYLDWLFDHCAEKGVYVMFCLNHHGQVSSQVNSNWSENPYNAANGGPCQNTWDFFSNIQAKSLIKNRLRYILARWGCQRSIMTWELFNEVNWTDNYEQRKPEIAAWHAEMAAFFKNNDYAARPVSTSYGSPQSEDPNVWNNPDVDYTQRHYYFDSPNLEAVLAAGVRDNLALYDKPALIGEFGLNPSNISLSTLDPDGLHFHNSLWGPLFGGGLGSGMSWWWDSYIEPGNLYYHLPGLSAMAQQLPLLKKDFRPAAASVTGAPSDLKVNASLDWSGLGDTLISISADGVITPGNFKLGQYLYGAQWNTQYRRPPVFSVNMPQAGKFKILTGSQFGTAPNLTIWLDGAQVLSVTPALNQTYMVDVPAGAHTLKVDNRGTDWMRIACYAFTGLGSAVDAYVLQSADRTRAAGWLLNSDYNHIYVKANGAPKSVSGALLKMENMMTGSGYLVKWFNCLTGALLDSEPVSVSSGGILLLPIPELTWDLAFLVDELPVSTAEVVQALPVSVFPNPVSEGPVNVSFVLESPENVNIILSDAGGATVRELHAGPLPAGEQNLRMNLGAALPPGIYWLQVAAGQKKAAKAIGVVR